MIDRLNAFPPFPADADAHAINRENTEALAEYSDEAILSPMSDETMDEYAAYLTEQRDLDAISAWVARREMHLAQQREQYRRLGLTLVPREESA